MKRIKEKQFIGNIENMGITVDPNYPDSVVLSFIDKVDFDRFWCIPKEARKIPFFIESILDTIDDWTSVFIWKNMGSWNTKIAKERLNDDIQSIIYRGIGIQDGSCDIYEIKYNEIVEVVALIFNQLIFGWCVSDDLYIIPNHGKQIIKTSHHDVVHVYFKNQSKMDSFIATMEENGFKLPVEIPDSTFSRPSWIK